MSDHLCEFCFDTKTDEEEIYKISLIGEIKNDKGDEVITRGWSINVCRKCLYILTNKSIVGFISEYFKAREVI